MIIGGLNASDVKILNGFADALMWAGHDHAADLIYAAVEAEQLTTGESEAADWREVFGA